MTPPIDNLHCPGCDGSPTGCTVCREAKPTPPETPSAKAKRYCQCPTFVSAFSPAYGADAYRYFCSQCGGEFKESDAPIEADSYDDMRKHAADLAQQLAAVTAERDRYREALEEIKKTNQGSLSQSIAWHALGSES